MFKTTAIEFTVSVATAQALAPSTATDEERARQTPLRCRIIVPRVAMAVEHGHYAQVFYQHEDDVGELTWTRLGDQAPVIAGLFLWNRVVVALAFHALVKSLLTEGLDSGGPGWVVKQVSDRLVRVTGRVVQEMPNGSVVIDLGEV